MKGSNAAKAKVQKSEPNGRSTADIIGILHKWGIQTLGQLAALNKEELRDRLGADAVRLWARANGTATRPLKLVQPPETFDESFEFDHEIETAEPLLFILRRFLEQLTLRLSSIYLVARELTLTIKFSGSSEDETDARATQVRSKTRRGELGPRTASPARTAARQSTLPLVQQSVPSSDLPHAGRLLALPTEACSYERNFKIPQPTNDVDLLFRMLQTHLENFKSEHPIVAVALSAEPIRPVSQQFGLFETALRNPHRLYETLARLTALVGNDRVGTPVLEETHRPDAFRMENFCWSLNNAGETPAATEAKKLRAIEDRASPARTRPYLNAGETRATTDDRAIEVNRPYLKPALRRFRPPARTSIFISDGRYLGGEADNWGQSPLPGDKIRGQIMDQVGPFLLSGNWWDEKAWSRAEYDMQLENGELVRAHDSDGKWSLDGIYD